MSMNTKVSNYVAPMHTGTVNESESARNALLERSHINSKERIDIERDSVKFVNDWNLDSEMGIDFFIEVFEKVLYFKKLSLTVDDEIFRGNKPNIFELMEKKRIDELFFTSNASNTRLFDQKFNKFMQNSKYLTKLSLNGFYPNPSSDSLVHIEIDIFEGNFDMDINLNNLPHLKTFETLPGVDQPVSNIKLTLPKLPHPIENISAINSVLEITNDNYRNYISNISLLNRLEIRFHGIEHVEKYEHINFLIDIVLNNEGILNLMVPPRWNYFREGDKLKSLTMDINVHQFGPNTTFLQSFPECTDIGTYLLPGYSLEKLPKNLKKLDLFFHFEDRLRYSAAISSLANLPELEFLKINIARRSQLPVISEFGNLPKSLKKIEIRAGLSYSRADARFLEDRFSFSGEDIHCPTEFDYEECESLRIKITGRLSYECTFYGLITQIGIDKRYIENNWNFIKIIGSNPEIVKYEEYGVVYTLYDLQTRKSHAWVHEETLYLGGLFMNNTFSFCKQLPKIKIINCRNINLEVLSGFQEIEIFNEAFAFPMEKIMSDAKKFLNIEHADQKLLPGGYVQINFKCRV